MEVILDSNFIISCVRERIDFLTDLEGMGFKILLPKEVTQELKDLKLELSHADRNAIDVAMEMFDKKKIKRTTLSKKSVDEGLIQMGRKGAYIATLDSAIKREVPNRVVISKATKGLVIERD